MRPFATVRTLFLSLVFLLSVPHQSFAQDIPIPVELTEYGSYNIHAAQAGLDEDGTRQAAYYVKGWLYFKGQPLHTALTVALSVAEPLNDLNLDKLQDICRQNLPVYKRILDEATPPFYKVESDGAIKTPGQRCEYYDLKAFQQVFTSEQARYSYEVLDPEHRKLVTAWRSGFQTAITEEFENFYDKFPELASSGILESLLSLDDRQLASAITSWEILYDIGSIGRIVNGAAAYISNRKFGENLPTPTGVSPRQLEESKQKMLDDINVPYVVKGEGASNSAAIAYKLSAEDTNTSCMQTGQPHQPWTERFNMVPYCISFKDSDNNVVPVFQVGYANTVYYNPLSASDNIASGGTADPVTTYEMFFMGTNGKQYFDNTVQTWEDFSTKIFTVQTGNGTFETIRRFSAGGFGDAFVLLYDPNTSQYFAVTGRRRNAENAKVFFTEEEVAIDNDADVFEESLSTLSAKFWGKTWCGPDGEGGQKAAIVNYQGQMHDMPGIYEFDPIYTNPVDHKFLRSQRVSNAYCNKVSYAVSDNGPLKGAAPLDECPLAASIPNAFDPGQINARQRTVQHFWEDMMYKDGVTTRDQLLEFGTGTYSWDARALPAVVAYVTLLRAGDHAVAPLVQTIAKAIAGYDGVHRGNEMSLFIYILFEEYKKYSTPPATVAPAIMSFISASGEFSVQAALDALDDEQARIFINILESAVDVYLNNCYNKGIRRYSDAIRVVYDGETIIEPGILNGPSPIGNARNTIGTRFDPQQCSIVAQGLSPLSHIYLDQKYKVYQFGTSASRHNLLSEEVHDISVRHWAEVLKEHNKEGKGYGGENSHIDLCSFDPNNPARAQTMILERFNVNIPAHLFSNKHRRVERPKGPKGRSFEGGAIPLE